MSTFNLEFIDIKIETKEIINVKIQTKEIINVKKKLSRS